MNKVKIYFLDLKFSKCTTTETSFKISKHQKFLDILLKNRKRGKEKATNLTSNKSI